MFNPWVRKILLEEEMATHSRILSWRTPWTGKPGGLRSIVSQSQTQLSMHTSEMYLKSVPGGNDSSWELIAFRGYFSFCVSVQFSSVAQSCPTLCNPMNCSMPGLPVHHQLPEFTQTHVHRVGDAIQPSHPLSSPSPPAPKPSQNQSLFQWVSSSHQVAKELELQVQH